jgi:beta-glucosidase
VGSDVWLLEHLPGTIFREPSGDACDFYHRYPDDVATVAALGLNAFRFGWNGRVSSPSGVSSRRRLSTTTRAWSTVASTTA